MLDHDTCQPTADVDAAIELLRPAKAKPANYDTPEGVLFRSAMGLIEIERNWIRGCPNVVSDGHCTISAIGATSRDSGGRGDIVINALRPYMGKYPHVFNDTHTHAEVMAKWRECGIANGWL